MRDHGRQWETRRQAEGAIFQYINGFCNPRRRQVHQLKAADQPLPVCGRHALLDTGVVAHKKGRSGGLGPDELRAQAVVDWTAVRGFGVTFRRVVEGVVGGFGE